MTENTTEQAVEQAPHESESARYMRVRQEAKAQAKVTVEAEAKKAQKAKAKARRAGFEAEGAEEFRKAGLEIEKQINSPEKTEEA